MLERKNIILIILGIGICGFIMGVFGWQKNLRIESENKLKYEKILVEDQLKKTSKDFEEYKSIDQIAINNKLNDEIKAIKESYGKTVKTYESLVDLKGEKKTFGKIDTYFAQVLAELGKENYASATATLKTLDEEIRMETQKRIVAQVPVVKANNEVLGFAVNVISADLKTTKVVVDTASESDCRDNCPVMSLGAFAQRSGAFAAINGPYFCPATYPACADKKNSFDTLMMNKNKTYFNSDNNVYSSVPAAIFSTTSRFVSKSQEWGRDTGVDSVIAGQPLLVFNGQSQFSGDGDPKKSGKGSRPFIGSTDSTVYIGIVYNATVAEAATVIAQMGIKNAINLDSGGSTAMWSNGKYIAGPGRDLPFGIMLVRR